MKGYKIECYLKVEPEEDILMSLKEVLEEIKQQKFLFPENIFKIQEVDLCIVCNKREGTSKTDGGDWFCDGCREKAELSV